MTLLEISRDLLILPTVRYIQLTRPEIAREIYSIAFNVSKAANVANINSNRYDS